MHIDPAQLRRPLLTQLAFPSRAGSTKNFGVGGCVSPPSKAKAISKAALGQGGGLWGLPRGPDQAFSSVRRCQAAMLRTELHFQISTLQGALQQPLDCSGGRKGAPQLPTCTSLYSAALAMASGPPIPAHLYLVDSVSPAFLVLILDHFTPLPCHKDQLQPCPSLSPLHCLSFCPQPPPALPPLEAVISVSRFGG